MVTFSSIGHISQNKHEFNLREFGRLNELISLKEENLKELEGFWSKFKARKELNQLKRRFDKHATEIIAYENQNR